jgi:hypothetical protein
VQPCLVSGETKAVGAWGQLCRDFSRGANEGIIHPKRSPSLVLLLVQGCWSGLQHEPCHRVIQQPSVPRLCSDEDLKSSHRDTGQACMEGQFLSKPDAEHALLTYLPA